MNMQNMMRQAQKLQKQMEQSQAELAFLIVWSLNDDGLVI